MDLTTAGKEKPTLKSDAEKPTADPFASDIFAAPKLKDSAETEAAAPPKKKREQPAWVWRLPKRTRAEADASAAWDALWQNLPGDFSDTLPGRLADALAGYLHLPPENPVEFLFFIKREIEQLAENGRQTWWAVVEVENAGSGAGELAVEIDNGFAAWLVDALLGEKVSAQKISARDLTPTEAAVLEFLAVNLIYEANRIISAPLFKLRSFGRQAPAWTTTAAAKKAGGEKQPPALLEATWQTIHGLQQSISKLYFTPETLAAMQLDGNALLTAPPRRRANWKTLEKRVKNLRARVGLGEARMNLADAAGLETSDVVLLENYNYTIAGGNFYGSAEIFLGDGRELKFAGTFEQSAEETNGEFADTSAEIDAKNVVRRINLNSALSFSVEYFEETESVRLLEKSMPEEELNLTDENAEEFYEDENGEATAGVPLENLSVTLRVELEARRLTLAEVGNLRLNQIIELGAHAADPVNLIIDDKVIARGELVEVDDRLGVRIVQILR